MFHKHLLLVPMALLIWANAPSYAQGCSDAGVCSIGSLKSSTKLDALYHSLTISNTVGIGEAGGSLLYIQTTRLEARIVFAKNSYFNLKVPLQYVSGNLSGNTLGLGDLAISYSNRLIMKPNYTFTLTIGGQVPGNRSTLTEGGLPLPMQYQSSLGSYDFMVGASLLYSSWHLAIGYQHPFTRNDNGFLRARWTDNADAQGYFESNRLKRGDDLVFRIQKSFSKGSRTFFVGILPIFRLQKDEIIRDGQVQKLSGSDELTLNINLSYLYELNPGTNVRFSYASPVIWRQTRADGLTRPAVLTAALELRI